jgi:hypothetical protein
MPKKFSQELRSRIKEQIKLKEIIEKSQMNWQDNLMMKKMSPNPYDCTRESSGGIEEVQQKIKLMEGIVKINITKKEKRKDYFKIMKPEEQKEKKKYNDWNFEEDLLLLKLCKTTKMNKKWRKISKLIGNKKTPRMCSYRFKKLSKFVYINKHNELIKRKSKPGDKESLNDDDIDIQNWNQKQQKHFKRKAKILSRKTSKNVITEEPSKKGLTRENTPLNGINNIIMKKDSNISMEKEYQLFIDYETTITDLYHLQLTEGQNRETDILFKQPFQLPKKFSNNSKNSYNNKCISDLEIKSISSMNSDNMKINLANFCIEKRSPLQTQNIVLHKTEFKKAYNMVFNGIGYKRLSSGCGDTQGKGTSSVYYFNKFEEVKLDQSDYVDNPTEQHENQDKKRLSCC